MFSASSSRQDYLSSPWRPSCHIVCSHCDLTRARWTGSSLHLIASGFRRQPNGQSTGGRNVGARRPRDAEREAGTLHVEFRDPLSELPETARNLILSAKAIIADHGFDALTLNRLALESGENKAMTAYYFGNKAGLIAAVLDSVIHDEYLDSQSRMRNLDAGELTPRLIEEMQDHRLKRGVPRLLRTAARVLRDDELRSRMLPLYRWYWSVKLGWLGLGDGPESRGRPRPAGHRPALLGADRRPRHPGGHRPGGRPFERLPPPSICSSRSHCRGSWPDARQPSEADRTVDQPRPAGGRDVMRRNPSRVAQERRLPARGLHRR